MSNFIGRFIGILIGLTIILGSLIGIFTAVIWVGNTYGVPFGFGAFVGIMALLLTLGRGQSNAQS